MATVKEKMTAIADAIRDKTGGTEPLTLDDMATDIPKVFDAGKQVQYDEFWDNYQNYGEGITPNYTFAYLRWTDANYNPKYPIKFTSTELTNTFYSTAITDTKVPIHIEGCNTNNTFRGAKIVTIRELIVDESTTYGYAGFPSSLENIKITGTIGDDIDFGSCTKLTQGSLISIMNALKDYSALGTTCTLTLGATNLAKLTDEEKALATQKGWTLA